MNSLFDGFASPVFFAYRVTPCVAVWQHPASQPPAQVRSRASSGVRTKPRHPSSNSHSERANVISHVGAFGENEGPQESFRPSCPWISALRNWNYLFPHNNQYERRASRERVRVRGGRAFEGIFSLGSEHPPTWCRRTR